MNSQKPALPPGSENTLVTRDFEGRWTDLPRAGLRPGKCAVVVDRNRTGLAAVWEHVSRSDTELLLVPASRYEPTFAAELANAGFTIINAPDIPPPPRPDPAPAPGRVWVSTSGSTGRPKQVPHTVQSLTTVSSAQQARRWLLPFTPGTYAWWQLVTLSLSTPDQDLVPVETTELTDWTSIASDAAVTAVSATPTFWRYALVRDRQAVADLNLEQITLGGEPVDQRLLDDLRSCLPRTRVSWIYAATETGAAFAVHDGRAGFPVSWLENATPDRPLLRVQNGELSVKSPFQSRNVDGYIHTGDRAEIRGDRVHLPGRITHDILNVGGQKVSVPTVRDALLEHPAVAWARVFPRTAPVVGQLVAAEVVAFGVKPAELRSWCAERLPAYAVPRLISFRDKVLLKEGLKSEL
jgi:acyl-CoA synthetase (AMP-forming)/AMP-acid ligase II